MVLIERNYKWSREEGETLWLQYFELLRKAVRSGVFSVISHPVRLRVNNPYLPPTFDEELERLAAEATSYDVALEINGLICYVIIVSCAGLLKPAYYIIPLLVLVRTHTILVA